MMKCEIIRDLIPLYLDKVCSEDSRKLVEEHLAECSECRKYMKELETELEAVKQKKEEDRKSIIAHAKELYSKLFDTTNKLDDVLKIDSPFFQETLNSLKKESPEYSDSYWYTLENLMSK